MGSSGVLVGVELRGEGGTSGVPERGVECLGVPGGVRTWLRNGVDESCRDAERRSSASKRWEYAGGT
jgi:hypothetical protein